MRLIDATAAQIGRVVTVSRAVENHSVHATGVLEGVTVAYQSRIPTVIRIRIGGITEELTIPKNGDLAEYQLEPWAGEGE